MIVEFPREILLEFQEGLHEEIPGRIPDETR